MYTKDTAFQLIELWIMNYELRITTNHIKSISSSLRATTFGQMCLHSWMRTPAWLIISLLTFAREIIPTLLQKYQSLMIYRGFMCRSRRCPRCGINSGFASSCVICKEILMDVMCKFRVPKRQYMKYLDKCAKIMRGILEQKHINDRLDTFKNAMNVRFCEGLYETPWC